MWAWLTAVRSGFARNPADLQYAARVTGVLYLFGASVLTVTLVLPHPAAGIGVIQAVFVVAAATGLIFLAVGPRAPMWLVHAGPAAGAFLISVVIYASESPGSPYAFMYFWVILVAAYFFRPGPAAAHTVWALGCYFATLQLLDDPSGYASGTRWLVALLALSVTGAVISLLVARRQRAERRTQRFFDLSVDLLCTVDTKGRLTEINAAWTKLLGYTEAELLAMAPLELIHPDDREKSELGLARQFRGIPTTGFENRYATKDGRWRWLQWSGILAEDESVIYARATDVTDRKQLEVEREALLERIEEQARTDALTGLPNRRWLQDELRSGIARAVRRGSSFWVAIIDLDHFKLFNDELGHLEGDECLKEAGESWRAALRAEDFIARFGGEEFVVLLADASREEVETAIDRLREATPRGQTCSAGIARWESGQNSDRLLGRADAALYEAKEAGRNCAVFAGPSDHRSAGTAEPRLDDDDTAGSPPSPSLGTGSKPHAGESRGLKRRIRII